MQGFDPSQQDMDLKEEWPNEQQMDLYRNVIHMGSAWICLSDISMNSVD